MSFTIHRVAQYAKFSSDKQRTESIDAQLRAMSQFCKQQHWEIVATYTDEARSAITDNRPQFQQRSATASVGHLLYYIIHEESVLLQTSFGFPSAIILPPLSPAFSPKSII